MSNGPYRPCATGTPITRDFGPRHSPPRRVPTTPTPRPEARSPRHRAVAETSRRRRDIAPSPRHRASPLPAAESGMPRCRLDFARGKECRDRRIACCERFGGPPLRARSVRRPALLRGRPPTAKVERHSRSDEGASTNTTLASPPARPALSQHRRTHRGEVRRSAFAEAYACA